LVIGPDTRFLRLGWRVQSGFVGARDRDTNLALPDYVSARRNDPAELIHGLPDFAERSEAAWSPSAEREALLETRSGAGVQGSD